MTFPSVYEMFVEDLTTVRKQHFWEYFSGATLNSRWTTGDLVGTGTFAMSDSVDGGFYITSGATSGNGSFINFNNKRQYAHNGSVIICIAKSISSASSQRYVGFDTDNGFSTNYSACEANTSISSLFGIRTKDGSTASSSQSDVSIDTAYHVNKMELGASDAKYTLDGVLKVTKTTNLQTLKGQPVFIGGTNTASAKTVHITYMEAYNT